LGGEIVMDDPMSRLEVVRREIDRVFGDSYTSPPWHVARSERDILVTKPSNLRSMELG
jgi:hypothetical protein